MEVLHLKSDFDKNTSHAKEFFPIKIICQILKLAKKSSYNFPFSSKSYCLFSAARGGLCTSLTI